MTHSKSRTGAARRPFGGTVRIAGLMAGVALLPMLSAGQAAAQEEPQARPAARTTQVEEIVVTARRRAESLQDVPASVTAFTGERLFETGALDIVAINDLVPNVTLEVSRSTNNTLTPFIRGVGQQDPVAGFEQGIGVYLDDVYLARPQGSVLEIYEVERVEVLRGPQGTLYGRNTIGGAIKYVTKRIGDEPAARVTVRGGTFRQRDAIVSADLPVTDAFRVGASVATFNRSGFGDNLINDGRENYNKDVVAARASMEFLPNPDLFIRLSGDFVSDESDPRQGHREVGGVQFPDTLDNVYDTRAGLEGPQGFEQYGFALNAEYDIDRNFLVKSITAYRADDSFLLEDFDSLPIADIDVPARFDNEQFTQELQLQYASDRLSGVAGFFYMNADAFNEFDVILATFEQVIGDPVTAYTLGDFETDTWSVFADVSYSLTDTIELTLGGRYTEDERTGRILRQSFLSGVGSGLLGRVDPAQAVPLPPSTDFEGSETFEDFTPRASIAWMPNEDLNLYFSWSQGFKGGSFDPRGDATLTPDFNGDGQIGDDEIKQFLLFEPEEVDTFELGAKATWLGGRLTTNVAVFYTDYTDIQIPGSVGVDTDGDGINDTFAGVTTNAGEAEIIGAEFEGQAILTDNLAVTGTVGFIDADFQEFIDEDGENVADERVFQNTPRWTASAALTYRTPLAVYGYDGEFTAIASGSYRGDTNQFEIPNPLIDTDAYALLNLSVIWTTEDRFLQIGLHGKNLTDEQYRVAGFNFPSVLSSQLGALGVEGAVTSFFGDPRTVMGSLTFNF